MGEVATLTEYTSKRRPRQKQAEALAKMEGKDAFALLMSMRVGKTKCIADDYGRLELSGKVKNLLVTAPGGNYEDWAADLLKDFSYDLEKRAKVHVWRSGATKAEEKALAAFMADTESPRAFIVNIEALSSVKRCQEACLRFLKSGPAMFAVDESTTIGNPGSARTKFINGKLAEHAEVRRILSGLPTPRDPLSLYSQFEFLDWRILNHRSFYAFRARYAIMWQENFGGRVVPIIKGFRDLDELYAKIEPYSFRATLADCYDLPPKQYSFHHVSLTEEQKRIYKDLKDYATAQLNATDHVTATVIVAQIIRLHQVLCGHTVDENGVGHDIPENRTDELLGLLERTDEKVIIWAAYDHDIQKIAAAIKRKFGEGSCARFWGGNKNTRDEEEARFKNDPECRFIVATAAAGGRGKEWSVANLVIYYSVTDNLEHQAQSEDRAQAADKATSVAYVFMIAPGTVETKFIHNVRNKINLSTAVLGEGFREWLI